MTNEGTNTTPTPASGGAASSSTTPQKSSKGWVIENVVSLGLALLFVFMIRSSLVEAFKIPSGSMIPTLFIGDHIFVNKFAYGLKIPFSDLFRPDPIYIIDRDPPKRGDVVVFKYPKDESIYYIKRVIGVPGDVVDVQNHVLYINEKPMKTTPVGEKATADILASLDDPKFSRSSIEIYHEHIDGAEHLMMIDKDNFLGENSGPFTVPPDHLFVMGDNRDFSNDSRFWGFVPFRNVKGKAMVIWLSWWVNFSELSDSTFKPERIGSLIH